MTAGTMAARMRLSIATSDRSRTPARLPDAGGHHGDARRRRPWPGPETHRALTGCCSAAPARGAGTAGPHLVEELPTRARACLHGVRVAGGLTPGDGPRVARSAAPTPTTGTGGCSAVAH